MRLTPAILSSRIPQNARLPDVAEIDCSGMGISHIEDISVAVNLHKLNLSNNSLKNGEALSGIQYNSEITWLNLSHNNLESLEGLEKLRKMLVVNVSHNQVNRISHHISNCKELKALILNNNQLKRIDNLSSLKNLGTLVLSHNMIDEITNIAALTSLVKLSATHNNIRIFPNLSSNIELQELRLSNNKLTSIQEDRILPLASSLKILDLGSNLFRSFTDIAALASLRSLVNLNLKGNPICSQEGYRERILGLVPMLRILDGERFDEKFLKRKQKKQAITKKLERKARKTENPPTDSETSDARLDPNTKTENRRKRKTEKLIESDSIQSNSGSKKSKTADLLKNKEIAKKADKKILKETSSAKEDVDDFSVAVSEPQSKFNRISAEVNDKKIKSKEVSKPSTESSVVPTKPTTTQPVSFPDLPTKEGLSGVVAVIDVHKSKKKGKPIKTNAFDPNTLETKTGDERLGLNANIGGWD